MRSHHTSVRMATIKKKKKIVTTPNIPAVKQQEWKTINIQGRGGEGWQCLKN